MNLDVICALSIKVSERKILLYLFEERIDKPSSFVNQHYIIHIHVKIISEQAYELWLFAFLDVHIGDYSCNMVDFPLAEHNYLLPIFHLPILGHIHAVLQHFVSEIFLQLGHIDHVSLGQHLKLFIVDIGSVHSHKAIVGVGTGGDHKGVVRGCGCEPHIARHAFIGVDDGMYFYATLLLASLWMTANALEQHVGKQRDCSGIYDSKFLHPCLTGVFPAVRVKCGLVGFV